MRIVSALLLILFFPALSPAGDAVYVRDGRIIIENEGGAKVIDYSAEDRYRPASPDDWRVSEERDPVDEALKVFKGRDGGVFRKKVRLFEKADGSKRFVVEYSTAERYDKFRITPDGRFAYYLALDDQGRPTLQGLNLLSRETVIIGQADNFEIVQCGEDQPGYVVIEDDGGPLRYRIYSVEGVQEDIVGGVVGFSDLKNYVCSVVSR